MNTHTQKEKISSARYSTCQDGMTLLHISTWLRFSWRMICCPPIPPSSERPSHHLVIIVVIVLCLDDLHLPQEEKLPFSFSNSYCTNSTMEICFCLLLWIYFASFGMLLWWMAPPLHWPRCWPFICSSVCDV